MSSSKSNRGRARKKDELWRGYEQLAGKFYEDLGYEVIERNWRAGRKEIDLIVHRDLQIIFVEVKSASTKKFGHPSERVDESKKRNLVDVAQQFIQSCQLENCDFQFDVITFVDGKLEHYPNAFTVD